MALPSLGPVCDDTMEIWNDKPTVHYSCRHIKHDDWFFNYHPHNLVCLVCGKLSDFLLFK